MPANNNLEPHSVGHKVEFSEIVKNVHPHLVNLEGFSLGETTGPRLPINVASHGLEGRQCLQGVEDRRLADVPGMNDQLGTTEHPDDLRP